MGRCTAHVRFWGKRTSHLSGVRAALLLTRVGQ
jgi:hypothetical protein